MNEDKGAVWSLTPFNGPYDPVKVLTVKGGVNFYPSEIIAGRILQVSTYQDNGSVHILIDTRGATRPAVPKVPAPTAPVDEELTMIARLWQAMGDRSIEERRRILDYLVHRNNHYG